MRVRHGWLVVFLLLRAGHVSGDSVSASPSQSSSASASASSTQMASSSSSVSQLPSATSSSSISGSSSPSLSSSSSFSSSVSLSMTASGSISVSSSVTPTVSDSSSVSASPSYSPSATVGPTGQWCDEGFCLNWKMDIANNLITMTMTAPHSSGWIGFGITNTAGQMFTAVSYVGWMSGGKPYLSSRMNVIYDMPYPDDQAGLTLKFGSLSGDSATITFTRPIVTDSLIASITEEDMDVIWASLSGDPPPPDKLADFQQHDTYGTGTINFYSGTGKANNSNPSKSWHGLLMGGAWTVLFPIAIIIGRFNKLVWPLSWLRWHAILNALGVIANIAAFAIIVTWTSPLEQFAGVNKPHKILGLVTFIIILVQPWLGFLAHRMYKPGREKTPMFPDVVHWWVGRLAILLGWTNCYLGLIAFRAEYMHFLVISSAIAVVAVVFVGLQYSRGRTRRAAPANIAVEMEGVVPAVPGALGQKTGGGGAADPGAGVRGAEPAEEEIQTNMPALRAYYARLAAAKK